MSLRELADFESSSIRMRTHKSAICRIKIKSCRIKIKFI